ncbi:MAG TPA: HEAT repeat domain-containing protein [Candidatus Polarisedimenticolia bacterium]|nr:HEAT repeat domain-containing protein [Candidatus Polarisedimenticolia bacterium]
MDEREHGEQAPGGGPGRPVDPGEPEQGFIRELSQFFIVPSLIVLLCVGVFILFGLLTTEDRSARDFLQEVRSAGRSDRWQAAFELSRAIDRQPSVRQDERFVQEVAGVLREEAGVDPRIRKYLVIALENLGHPAGGAALVEALSDPDAEVRLHAARAVGVLGKIPGSAGPLEALLSDDDAGIRKVAVYALGRTGDPAAVAALRPRLEDEAQDIRWNAALALAVLGDPSGRDVLATMLDRAYLDRVEGITEDQKVNALINGVQGVYVLREPSLKEHVRELSEDDPSLKVRSIALEALKEWDAPGAPR